MSLHFGIIAATFSGNRGAEAMLLSTIHHLRQKDPSCIIHVLSYSPKADIGELNLRPIPEVYIHSSTPATLVFCWFWAAILLSVLPFLKKPLKRSHSQGMGRLVSLDAVFCLAGVSFIDGREKFLPFNVLTLLPFLINKVPVFKMAQAMGPITSPINTFASRLMLPRCSYVFARGHITASLLKTAGVLKSDQWRVSPDIAFGLSYAKPQNMLADIAIIPSVILDRKHSNYRDLLVDMILKLQAMGVRCNFVVHSWKSHTTKPFNNDLPLVTDLAKKLAAQNCPVNVLGEGKNASEIKSLVAAHRVCLTSRFHGMIAGLDSGVPTLVIGWSHKYREILHMFGKEHWALKYDSSTPESCAGMIHELLSNYSSLNNEINVKASELRTNVQEAFDTVWKLIKNETKQS